jgi:hypothetical protein
MNVARDRRAFVVALLLTSGAFAAKVAPQGGSPLDLKLTLKVTHTPLWKLLESVSTQTKAGFILADGVDDSAPVTVDAKDEAAGEVLKTVLEGSGLVLHRIARTGKYVVLSQSQADRAPEREAVLANCQALNSRMRIRATNTPLNQFLEMITAETKVNFVLDTGRDKNRVTLDLKDVSARDALEAALEVKGLSVTRIGKDSFLLQKNTTPARR